MSGGEPRRGLLPMVVSLPKNPPDEAGALVDWPSDTDAPTRETTRRLVRSVLAAPGTPIMLPVDGRRVAVVGDASVGASGAVRGSLHLLGEIAQVDVVAGLRGEGAPVVVDHAVDSTAAAIARVLLPALLELVAAKAAPESGAAPELTWE